MQIGSQYMSLMVLYGLPLTSEEQDPERKIVLIRTVNGPCQSEISFDCPLSEEGGCFRA